MYERGALFGLFLFLLIMGIACEAQPASISPNLEASTAPAAVVATVIVTPTQLALPPTQTAVPTSTPPPTAVAKDLAQLPDTAVPTATFAAYGVAQTIGYSAGGRPIESYRFGFGSQTIVLVGGMHGGYEWNTILLAYEMIDYFLANPGQVPANISLYIIPSANPDGQWLVTGQIGRFTAEDVSGNTRPGRFNANQVDLNRNWACDWQAEGLWGETVVSGGTVPFSEPETAALRTFFLREAPEMVLFWHSKADGVFIGSCGDFHQPSADLAAIYGRASGYAVNDQFTAYPVSGDASDWLTTQNIPSFTVELKTHSNTDWSLNLAGVLAILEHYGR